MRFVWSVIPDKEAVADCHSLPAPLGVLLSGIHYRKVVDSR